MAKQRKHNFLVGYKEDGHVVFGEDSNYFKGTYPLTLLEAKRKFKKLPCLGGVIFELVEVKG